MVLSAILQRFLEQRPVAVMIRVVLEKQFSDQFFDQTFDAMAQEQYTRELAFSTCARLLGQVSLGQAASVHAAFVKGLQPAQAIAGLKPATTGTHCF